MAYRKTILANDQVYHIYNRGVSKMEIFRSGRDYKRFINLIDYYRFANLPLRFSHFQKLSIKEREAINFLSNGKVVEVIAYCLMPNHFHLILKQISDKGISTFLSRVSNSYARYFNLKNAHSGHLLEGNFKAVRVENDEQLIHLSRYIHLNPVTSFIIKADQLAGYRWSSIGEFLGRQESICDSSIVLDQFASAKKYRDFLEDQIDYAKKLKECEHLILEDY
jgi:putative transposase